MTPVLLHDPEVTYAAEANETTAVLRCNSKGPERGAARGQQQLPSRERFLD